MAKRIMIVSILSVVLLLTLTVSLGMAQQGTTGQTSDLYWCRSKRERWIGKP